MTKGTAVGAILGTAAYMSPEQARGKVVDERTDIWAFGCCLYQALTGRPAFDGETVTDVLAAVVHKEPNWSALPGGLSQRARDVLQRCLRKDPSRRVHDIADVRIEVEESDDVEPSRAGGNRRAGWAAVVAAFAAGIIVWSIARPRGQPSRPVRFFHTGSRCAVHR